MLCVSWVLSSAYFFSGLLCALVFFRGGCIFGLGLAEAVSVAPVLLASSTVEVVLYFVLWWSLFGVGLGLLGGVYFRCVSFLCGVFVSRCDYVRCTPWCCALAPVLSFACGRPYSRASMGRLGDRSVPQPSRRLSFLSRLLHAVNCAMDTSVVFVICFYGLQP